MSEEESIHATHQYISPVEFKYFDNSFTTTGIDVFFLVKTKWFSQIVTIDASLGIYDYLRGKVRLAPGESQYAIKGLNLDGGKPIDFIPKADMLGVGLREGEMEVNLMLIKGLDMADPKMTPDLSSLIVPEDLELLLIHQIANQMAPNPTCT